MGSCISKCRSKSKIASLKECHLVQDKLVISQAPTLLPHHISTPKIAPAPPSPSTCTFPSSSSSSFSCTTSFTNSSKSPLSSSSCNSACLSSPSSSFSCTTTFTNSSKSPLSLSSSNSTCSSSNLTWKDRSYSNEFLWSCLKDNPHLISSVPVKYHAPPTELIATTKTTVSPKLKQQLSRPKPSSGARASSPPLKRQKSFRREPDKLHQTSPLDSGRVPEKLHTRSPLHRRTTNVDTCKGTKEIRNSEVGGIKRKAVSPLRSSIRNKENVRPLSPSNNRRKDGSVTENVKTRVHRIESGVDEKVTAQTVTNQHLNSLPMDDVDNPLISLDCFIFL